MNKLKLLFKVNFFIFIIISVVIGIIYLYAYFTPPIDLNIANKYYFYDNKDNIINELSNNSNWVSIDDIDNKIIDYIINIEDKHFYNHKGFDISRIIKSLITNIKSKEIISGASSISQQYVKNLFLTFDKTWKRKINEAFLTVRLETHYDKNKILEGYLNTIYFGNGIYGIKDASLYYFNKEPKDLTIEEAITLVGIPKSPNNYNPISNNESFNKRFNEVSSILLNNKKINKDDYNSLNINNLNIIGKLNNKRINTILYYKDAVINELNNIDVISDSLIKSGGLRIYTNLDIDTQSTMDESLNKNKLDDNNQISSIVIDPETGKVVSLMGGVNYNISQYNRTLYSKRQIGSIIKPFLYYAALSNGMTSASKFNSSPTTFNFSNNSSYTPSNYSNIYANKEITMAQALAYSDNIYAVKTHLFLGTDVLPKMLNTCGLKESLSENPSLALGAEEINMYDLAHAYTTLASGGYKKELYFINKIEDINGNLLYIHEDNNEQVLDESITYILNEMMRNTYNYNFVDYVSPTVIYLNGKLDRKYAIKSGTTDNDYWLSGYNKKGLMLIWAGNDNNEKVSHDYSKIIKNIWLDTMNKYEENITEDTWYIKPDNVVSIPISPITGEYDIKSKTLFYFISGTEVPYIKNT